MAMQSLRVPRRGSLSLAAFLALAWVVGAHADTPATPSSAAPAAQPITPVPAPSAKAFSVKSDAAPAATPVAEAKPATAASPKTGKSSSTKTMTTAKPAAPAAARPAPAPQPDPGQAYIKPFPGSRQTARSNRNFDEYWMPLGKLSGESQAEKVERIEGRWTHAGYLTSGGPSVAEVFRHYEGQVTKAGLEIVYSCKGIECGEGGRKTNGDWWALSDHRRYLAARLARPGGDLWVAVHVHAKTPTSAVVHQIDVVEARPPVVPPPVRNEAEVATLAKDLKSDGRVVLRQIGFADGRANVLPQSEPVVRAIADLLARDPSLKFYLVAHSDDTGSWNANVDLTKKRANAVVSLLTRKFGVRSGRVQPAGVGPLSPLASNTNDEGRARNRRIELVPQGGGRAGGPAAAARR